LITITDYNGDAMEPFISRDGAYLFFNNNTGGPTDKDLFYATFVNGTTFQYRGAIDAVNSPTVDGAPTMDDANNFYYVSTANYNPPAAYETLYVGTWNGSTVTGGTPLSGLTITTPSLIYFDIDVSPDGSTLYLSEGDFTGGSGVPSAADIVMAVDSGSGFTLDPNSAVIMASVNTTKLEYAPAISADGLELFFTRFDPNTAEARIYRATRSNKSNAFGVPQLVPAIEGFVEGPAFSPDEKSLYYHRENTGTGRFEIYRVTRP
jgi:Tol biopolymer transport system component